MAEGTKTPDAVEKKPRSVTSFVVFTRNAGDTVWGTLPAPVSGRTQDEAKRNAARTLSADPAYADQINGDGLELAVAPARSFRPVVIKVEPQPAKVVLR